MKKPRHREVMSLDQDDTASKWNLSWDILAPDPMLTSTPPLCHNLVTRIFSSKQTRDSDSRTYLQSIKAACSLNEFRCEHPDSTFCKSIGVCSDGSYSNGVTLLNELWKYIKRLTGRQALFYQKSLNPGRDLFVGTEDGSVVNLREIRGHFFDFQCKEVALELTAGDAVVWIWESSREHLSIVLKDC